MHTQEVEEEGFGEEEEPGSHAARRTHHQPESTKRGQLSKITKEHVKRMERIIDDGGFNHRAMSWQELGTMAGLLAITRSISILFRL